MNGPGEPNKIRSASEGEGLPLLALRDSQQRTLGRIMTLVIAIVAIIVTVLSATDHASSWNDGSRLATIECLVDHRAWAIDESVFVTPPTIESGKPHPYGLRASEFPNGTLDKLLIDGHFYSDKSPVPALLMAGFYSAWRACGGPSAAERPDLFCWWMSLTTVGMAYVVAVMCINVLACRVGLSQSHRLLAIAAFGLGTLALPYSRSVNNHELLLGVTAALLLALDRSSYVWAGCLAGLAYTIDLGAGPAICAGAAGFAIVRMFGFWRTGSVSDWRSFAPDNAALTPSQMLYLFTAMVPWLILHHALNYHIGGTWRPANANPEYFRFPGCPFDATTLSGMWNHSSIFAFLAYAIDLLVGKKGFWGHNLPLLVALPGLYALMVRPHRRRGIILLCMAWCVGVWLIYAAGSKNYSGACVSVRWFVPLIAPLMYAAMLSLRERPAMVRPLACLTACGIAMNCMAWWHGPWHERMIEGYWVLCAMGIAGLMWQARPLRQSDVNARLLSKAA
jgi:hypothetical protein